MRPPRTVLAASLSSRNVASMDTTSRQIEDDTRAEIAGDPRIPYPSEIAVEVVDGIATLRGTVGSFAQPHAAVSDVRHAIKKAFKRDASLDAEALSIDTLDGTVVSCPRRCPPGLKANGA